MGNIFIFWLWLPIAIKVQPLIEKIVLSITIFIFYSLLYVDLVYIYDYCWQHLLLLLLVHIYINLLALVIPVLESLYTACIPSTSRARSVDMWSAGATGLHNIYTQALGHKIGTHNISSKYMQTIYTTVWVYIIVSI